jgi:hypothetical protein
LSSTSKSKPPIGIVRRALTLAIGCIGLAWGISELPQSEEADDLQDIEYRLLASEAFSPKALALRFERAVSQNLSACDTHSQRAMLLMEMPLAEAALRSGAAAEFDRRIQSLEVRSKRVLSCAPRESFVWLLLFNLEVLHGQLNEHAFNLLAMSYETSPNEAWISIRRIVVATPLILIAGEPLRNRILNEFQQLIRNGFVDDAARSFSAASKPIRSLLLSQIDRLDLSQQKSFLDALQRLRS